MKNTFLAAVVGASMLMSASNAYAITAGQLDGLPASVEIAGVGAVVATSCVTGTTFNADACVLYLNWLYTQEEYRTAAVGLYNSLGPDLEAYEAAGGEALAAGSDEDITPSP